MRLEKFRQQMQENDLAGFLVTQPENRRYLSGFTGSNGVLIITPEAQLLATDSRYYEQVRQECPAWELVEAGYNFAGHMLEILRRVGLGGRRVGFEAGHISLAGLHKWERALEGRLILVHTQGFVEELRQYKDEAEIAAIKKAVAVADEAMRHLLERIRPGMTELEVAWSLESYMRTHGASRLAFDTIVASGPNSALPHAGVTRRPLQAGEPIIIDWGCVVEGYHSDATRTFCLGQPADEQYLAVWHTVQQAQQAVLSAAKGGMTGQEVHNMAHDVIKEAGYGDYFQHSLGHGVGLAIHEEPRYSAHNPDEVPGGSVMTVEPGIYLPGWGGVRLEELAVVRDEGLEVLTSVPTEAVIPTLT